MNGSENGYAGALFFALISLGAVLKIEEMVTGCAICAGGALLAAISLRRALNRSAQAAEEDHQRMEIQFQQLRAKINETAAATIDAMSSLSEVTQLLRDNLKIIREQSATMEDLISLIKNAESVNSLVASLEENSAAQNVALEKIFDAIQSQEIKNAESINSLVAGLEENASALNAALENIFITIQNSNDELKKLAAIEQAAAQTTQNSYTKDLEKIHAALEKLGANETAADLKNSVEVANKNLAALVKINSNLSRSVTTTLDNLRFEVVKLSNRLESINGVPSEGQTPLTAE
ncbi:MAG: hypothetical protein IJP68_02615, partial [Selenomonadaceae bacterium]|nr:hypothetical protein [Selenomonadaceae bacterium]